MIPGEAPPPLSSTNRQIQAAGGVDNQPPSYRAMDHSQGDTQNRFQDGVTYRRFDHTAGVVDSTKAPSFTALGHGQGNSYNSGGNFSREIDGNSYGYGSGGQPLSVGDMAKGAVSQTSGDVDPYSYDKAPGLSDVNRHETSQTGESLIVIDDPDAQELVGMSLVGKNFRKFYPNAYYKEKDDEN